MPKNERILKYQLTPAGSVTHTVARGGSYDSGLYVRVDGTRKMTADWDAGGYEIESTYFDVKDGYAYLYNGIHILSAPGSRNLLGGQLAGDALDVGTDVVYLGYGAGEKSTDDSENVAVGSYALNTADGADDVVAIGYAAMEKTTTGAYQVAVGVEALQLNTTGYGNTAVGMQAIEAGGGNENAAFGYLAGQGCLGSENTNIGAYSSANSTNVSGCVTLGFNAGADNATSNRLYIANSATVTPLIYGEFDNAELGINIGSGCAGTLHVDQSSTTGAKPVLVLDQADVDVVAMKIIGTANSADADYTLAANSDFGTPGALVGWIQVEIQDDGNRVTDGDFYIPFYAVPT